MKNKDISIYSLPKWCNKEKVIKYGLDEVGSGNLTSQNIGYYFYENGTLIQTTNFIIIPKYFLETEGVFIGLLDCGQKEPPLIIIPVDIFKSKFGFEIYFLDRGYYTANENFTKTHFNKLKSYFFNNENFKKI